eukprot:COSAG06_NODE_432_length_15846_cov_18.957325_13_plen_116_part_00
MVRGADGGGAAVRGGLDADVGCAGEQRRLQRRRAVAWAAHDQALDGGCDHKQGCCEEPHLAVGWASGRSWWRDETNARGAVGDRSYLAAARRPSMFILHCPFAAGFTTNVSKCAN